MSGFKGFGFTCWLTGLSGAGKSTIAVGIAKTLNELLVPYEQLDGDIIRTNLSKNLGFSRAERNSNIERVSFVCKLLNKHGVSTIVSLISPARYSREKLRSYLPNFIEIYVDTPLEICIERDVKGLYKKAIAGEIAEFTGISSPYEAPLNPDVILKPHEETVNQCVEKVLKYFSTRGFIPKY